ncbi:MAG TPA: hypothetical protein VF309_03340 [Usitatibacter sp.]
MKSNRLLFPVCMATLAALCGCAGPVIHAPDRGRFGDAVQKCVASAHDRNACARLANQRCGAGFEVFEMDAVEEDGVERRAFHFRCL